MLSDLIPNLNCIVSGDVEHHGQTQVTLTCIVFAFAFAMKSTFIPPMTTCKEKKQHYRYCLGQIIR